MYEHRKIRVAALADFHYTRASAGQLKDVLVRASETAVLLGLAIGFVVPGFTKEKRGYRSRNTPAA